MREIKYKAPEMKNGFAGVLTKQTAAEEGKKKITELEESSVETTHTETHRYFKKKRKK